MKKGIQTILPVLFLAAGLNGFSAEPATVTKSSQWKHDLTVYMLFAGMSGTVGVGDTLVEIDVPFDEIMSNLEFGMMANYRAEKGKLSLGLDFIYMGLGGEAPGVAEVDIDQWMVEGSVGWRVSDMVELLAGVRFIDLGTTIQVLGEDTPISADKSWFDPIVGAKFLVPLGKSFSLAGRGDIGGFGLGSELTWQLAGYLRYTASDSIALLLGYRYLYVDYEDGMGPGYFLFDVATQGPVAGITFSF